MLEGINTKAPYDEQMILLELHKSISQNLSLQITVHRKWQKNGNDIKKFVPTNQMTLLVKQETKNFTYYQ